MSTISKSRTLGLLIFTLSILSINIILLLSQIFEFKDLPVPGNYFKDIKIYDAGDALRDKQGLKDDGFVIPYIDGSTSISRLGRVFPNNLIFKPLMIFCGFLMCIFWSYQKKMLSCFIINEKLLKKMYFCGLITGVFLIIHITFLGVKIDNNFYKLFIRLILGLCVLFGIYTKILFVNNVKIILKKKLLKNNIYFKIQYYLVYLLLFSLLISILLALMGIPKTYILIIEWNYYVLIFIFYFLYFLSWKSYSFIQPPPKTL